MNSPYFNNYLPGFGTDTRTDDEKRQIAEQTLVSIETLYPQEYKEATKIAKPIASPYLTSKYPNAVGAIELDANDQLCRADTVFQITMLLLKMKQ